MEHYLYLALDLLSLFFPLLFSFLPKANFSIQWRSWIPAILLPAVLFIVWDECFTSMGVWGFNPRFITGFYISHLPFEEVLFFLFIPYACLFTYQVLKYISKSRPLPNTGIRITWILMVSLFAMGVICYDRWYPAVAFLSLSIYLAFLLFIVKPIYMGRFYFFYLLILIPFFLINGILTGTGLPEPIVWYNNAENLGIRLGTIPFEDTFYGMLLILMNVSIFEFLEAKKK